MAEGCRAVALEEGMGEPGGAVAGKRRGDERAPVAAGHGKEEEGKAEAATEVVGGAGARVAVGAQIMRPELGVAGDRRGPAASLPQMRVRRPTGRSGRDDLTLSA